YLERLNYRVERQHVKDNRFNVFAMTDAPQRIVFSTHIDTVPPFIESREDADYIYGRGSCDAKGIIACQIFAAEKLRAEGFDEFGLLFTVDEELASAGARLANLHPTASENRFLINGEPTENMLALGTKGSMRIMISTRGQSAHSAYPEAGESAIETLLDILNDIRAIDWPSDSLFGPTTCNIGVINGGTRPNVIPDHASAEVQIRLTKDTESIRRLVAEAIDGRAEMTCSSAHNPVRLMQVTGFKQAVMRFTTDIPYLTNWGTPLLIGPGSILDAHTDHERVLKNELVEAVDLYVKLAVEVGAQLQNAD
ncbi:MAG: peptidase dimerization protein, partial [Blastocatellia bacterium]